MATSRTTCGCLLLGPSLAVLPDRYAVEVSEGVLAAGRAVSARPSHVDGRGRGRRLAPLGLVRGDIDGSALPDHRHLDLAGVLELVLDLASDLVRQKDSRVVVDVGGPDDHPDLAAGLQRVDLVDTRLRGGELLQCLEPLDVVLEALAARTRPGGRDRIGGD